MNDNIIELIDFTQFYLITVCIKLIYDQLEKNGQ